jgi:hypothetical protein
MFAAQMPKVALTCSGAQSAWLSRQLPRSAPNFGACRFRLLENVDPISQQLAVVCSKLRERLKLLRFWAVSAQQSADERLEAFRARQLHLNGRFEGDFVEKSFHHHLSSEFIKHYRANRSIIE